jgi:geranylgeranyl pyrophosphate synthase
MDDDALRRGLPTAHRVYGVAAATAAGAALQHRAFLALARAAVTDPGLEDALPGMVHRLARAAGAEGMVGGQYLDLVAEGTDVDAPGLEAIHRGKTAALLAAAAALGGIAAGAGADEVDALSDYGTNLGLAFQIVDDLLDVVGDPTATGKASGADAEREKATYPAVHGVEEARRHAGLAAAAARAALARLAGPDADGPARVLEEMVDFVIERIH